MFKTFALIVVAALFVSAAMAWAQDQDGEAGEQAPSEQSQPEAQAPQEAVEFLQDRRPASELSDEELGRRTKQARHLLKRDGLSRQMRQDIKTIAEQLRSERQTRMAAGQKKSPDVTQSEAADGGSGSAPAPSETVGETAEVSPNEPVQASPRVPRQLADFLADTRTPSALSDRDLARRAKQARDFLAIRGLDPQVKDQLRTAATQIRSERMARQQANGQSGETAPAGSQVEAQPERPSAALDGQKQAEVTQEQAGGADFPMSQAETKARAMLADGVSAESLSNEQLTARLQDMRNLLQAKNLSRETQHALRKKLKTDREILRTRMASAPEETEKPTGGSAAGPAIEQPRPGKPRQETQMDMQWREQDVLRDRRSSTSLETGQLRRRMAVYRDAMGDNQYAEDERNYWRSGYERDRGELRRRMHDERRQRQNYWDEQRREGNLDINVDIAIGGNRPPPAEIWADEVEDEEIEDQLLAAPRRQVQQRYTIEDFEDEPELREVMPGVEIDTIEFGFNEAFVREEEIENLDRIAETVEKILAARPGEVFLIEGYTDAVGSAAYNLQLSRQRAQAVKEALTTYYVIPPRNLETIGYGERYLKIPTEEPEQENRRVALRRVTPLVGELSD